MVESITQVLWNLSLQHPMVGLLIGVMVLMLLYVGLNKIQHGATRLFILSATGILFYSIFFTEGDREVPTVQADPDRPSRYVEWFDKWRTHKNDIQVIAKPLSVVLQDQDCRYEPSFEVKSTQVSFFVPLDDDFDLLLFRLSNEKFMAKVRYKNERHILRTMQLRLQEGVFLDIDYKQYRLLYQMTDDHATVISVTRCYCQPKPSLQAQQLSGASYVVSR